jgi:hypothetical protein
MENIIEIIQKHSLTVRCLPHEVVECWTYIEGDELKKYVDSNGNPCQKTREVVVQNLDLAYFQNTHVSGKWNVGTPEERYEKWKKNFPNGKKLLKVTRKVEHGGWWYVKSAKNTDSTIRFDRKYDKFFAPTLEEAIKLYLDSLV